MNVSSALPKISSLSILLLALTLEVGIQSKLSAQDVTTQGAPQPINITNPPNAPIYVLEGHMSETLPSTYVSNGRFSGNVEADTSMDINTGAVMAMGTMSMNGYVYSGYVSASFDLNANMAIKGVAKQAGTVVRWSGKAAAKGNGQYDSDYGSGYLSFSATFTYSNMELNPITGYQSGMVSISGSAKADGVTVPLKQAPTYTVIPILKESQISSNFKDTSGQWALSMSSVTDNKGKVSGTSQLVIGDPADPYAIVPQKVTGKLNTKTGVVTLSGVGINKLQSKAKVSLNLDSAGVPVPNKNSISAYGQTQRF